MEGWSNDKLALQAVSQSAVRIVAPVMIHNTCPFSVQHLRRAGLSFATSHIRRNETMIIWR